MLYIYYYKALWYTLWFLNVLCKLSQFDLIGKFSGPSQSVELEVCWLAVYTHISQQVFFLLDGTYTFYSFDTIFEC